MNDKNKQQQWLCEDCGLSGAVTILSGEDVMSVVNKIRLHHDRLAVEHCPDCVFNTSRVRVKSTDQDIYSWNRQVAKAESAALRKAGEE